MKCPCCGVAALIHDTRDMSYTYKGETTTISTVTGKVEGQGKVPSIDRRNLDIVLVPPDLLCRVCRRSTGEPQFGRTPAAFFVGKLPSVSLYLAVLI